MNNLELIRCAVLILVASAIIVVVAIANAPDFPNDDGETL